MCAVGALSTPHLLFDTMANEPPSLRAGCTVTVPAARFDIPGDDRWSVQQFGAEADTKVLECRVMRQVGSRWKLLVLFDKDIQTLEEEALSHTEASCRLCWPRVRRNIPPRPTGAAGIEERPDSAPVGGVPADANRARPVPQRTGTSTDSVPNDLPEDDDEDLPLGNLTLDPQARQPATTPESPRSAPQGRATRVRRPSQRAIATMEGVDLDEDEMLSDSSEEDLPGLEDATDSDESDDEDLLVSGGRRGGGRGGRGGRGGGRAGGGPPRSPEHGETETHVKRHRVSWLKGGTREIDPMLSGGAFVGRSRLTLHNYTEKRPLEFFEHCFPPIVDDIASATTLAGRRLIRPTFSVSKGEMWLFLAEKGYMNVYPQEGPKEHYWEVPDDERIDTVFVDHNLGKFGHGYNRYKDIERSFRLPTHGDSSDFFDPIRRTVDEWNARMEVALDPGPFLTVDESMAGWKGKGMPGLMSVPRKPTPVGREAHTTADATTGVIIHYEMYEGKDRMAHKEFVDIAGKNPAKALRCVKPWFGSGRCVILDSGFASVSCALSLRDKGMHMIGNVKSAHKMFPKAWLLSQAPHRGDWATCTATVKSPGGLDVDLLCAADRDKQPMALLGTVGSTVEGETLHRAFTTIRADGTYNSREATLRQMQIHELYRKFFNALDKNNSYRQGRHNLEDSWKTKRWYVREFQALWGMSEVNAWLLYRKFVPGAGNVTFTEFRKRLVYAMLHHPSWVEERMRLRSQGAEGNHSMHTIAKIGVSASGVALKRTCVMCGIGSEHCCTCTPTRNMPGIPICNPSGRRPECHAKHLVGERPPNRRSESRANVWKRKREENGGGRATRGRGRRGRGN